ncbi:MAG: hypothetical protein HFE40_01945 [Clostridia bacterium]|jgi:vacuolar-type H+-ATPase subunit H|nr:hypothetical protein [Clostridia bacterium]
MNEIIKSITEAEERAEALKEAAQVKSAAIIAQAETEAEQIAKRCETDCKLYRESQIRKAEKEAEENYLKSVSDKKAKAKAYADGVLKNCDSAVSDVVRRITRGSC